MPENKLINMLKDLGLTENEAKVYYASLSLGPTTILNIARAAETKRTTVYSVVESLKEKGLMRLNIKGFKQLYVAEAPAKLESILESKKSQLHSTLPEFSALYNLQGGEGFIKHYEGLEAVKSVYDQLLKSAKPKDYYNVISDSEKWIETDQKFYRKYLERRAKLNINAHILTKRSPTTLEQKQFSKNYKNTIKFLPEKTKLTTNLVVIPSMLVIHQIIPPIMAIVIENKSIINTNKQIFDLLWDSID